MNGIVTTYKGERDPELRRRRPAGSPIDAGRSRARGITIERILKHRYMYLMALPALVWFVAFKWMTAFGILVAFEKFNAFRGVFRSAFVGFANFVNVLHNPELPRLVVNILAINAYKILFGLPAPILLALLLNEIKSSGLKRTLQTIYYIPHFITWVIIGGMLYGLLNYHYGFLNAVIEFFGGERISWYQAAQYWRGILVGASIWKEVGWSTIIYLAVLSATVNPETYEASIVDGATRFQQIRHLTLPALVPVIGFNLVWMISGLFNSDVTEFFALIGYNPFLFKTVDSIDYFLFRAVSTVSGTGGTGMDFGMGFLAAFGIIQSCLVLCFFIIGNWAAKRYFRWTGMF